MIRLDARRIFFVSQYIFFLPSQCSGIVFVYRRHVAAERLLRARRRLSLVAKLPQYKPGWQRPFLTDFTVVKPSVCLSELILFTFTMSRVKVLTVASTWRHVVSRIVKDDFVVILLPLLHRWYVY